MWKEVFKAGAHIDAAGNEREWSQDDLDSIVAKYNNQLPDDQHEAPVVIGHPVNNSPAYAWVEALRRDGDTLLAKFTQVEPQFEELVNEGRYKKVSIALYPGMMLRHVGYLGAVPPAVKGLKDSEFNSSESFIAFEAEQKTNTDRTDAQHNVNSVQTKDEQMLSTTRTVFEQNLNDVRTVFEQKSNDVRTELEQNANKNEQVFNRCSTDAQQCVNKTEQSFNKIEQRKGKEKKVNIYSPSKSENFEAGDQNHSFSANKNSDTTKNLLNISGGEMPDKLSNMFQELLGWMGQTFNQEVASQTAAELEKMKAKYLTSQDNSNQGGNSKSSNHSETEDSSLGADVSQSREFQELQKKLQVLENDNREMKFNEYFKSQAGRLVPAQKQIVKLAFNALQGSNAGFEFSEGGQSVKLSGEDLIKRLIESFPTQVEFSEIAQKSLYDGKSDFDDQNNAIDQFNKRNGGK